jgi:hypothetical protein
MKEIRIKIIDVSDVAIDGITKAKKLTNRIEVTATFTPLIPRRKILCL